jgi:hypothetical protein
MPAQPRTRRSQWPRERRWDQTSFLDEDGAATGAGSAPREIEDVLGVADHAADTISQRDALDQLYDSLAQRALRHGRKPVPKRSDSQGAT